ncbi:MAG: lysophospholipid acyltransferase family protein [Candidatus Eisenbacteria bacterium]
MAVRRATYALSQWLVRVLLRIFCGLRYEGTENVPLEGACLLAANHKSYLDPPTLGSGLKREIRYFAKRELFSVPLLGTLIHHYGAIPVDRDAFDRRQLARALELLAAGHALLVFPEGTRIRRDGYGEPKVGIALLAEKARVPIVPVYLASTWEPRRSLFRRIPIVVRYGRPLPAPEEESESRRERYEETTRAVMAAIHALSVAS